MKHNRFISGALPVMLVACAASLAACVTGPHYAGPPPQPVLDKSFVNAPLPAAVQAAALETWWTQLGDPTLDALVADTLAHNPDLDIAAARLRQARAQRRIVRADGLPSVSAAGLAQRQSFSENIDLGFGQGGGQQGQGGQEQGGQEGGGQGGGQQGGGQQGGGQQGGGFDASGMGAGGAAINFFQASFDVAWEVDLFGATRAKVNASDAEVEAAAFGVEDVRTSIAAEVARDYLVVREVQARLALTRSTLATARRTQALAREQERAGLVTEADTARTDAQVLAVETALPQLELLELQARQRLAVLAGREPSALAATLAPVRPIPAAHTPVAAGMPAELLLRRPDLRMAERQLAAATHFEAGAVRDLYPKLSLSGAGGVQADTVGSLFDWSSRFFRLTANLTAPIIDGGRRRGEVELQRGRVDEAAARYRRTVLGAFREVEEGLAALGRNARRSELAERTVERRRKARAVLDEQYRAGLVGLLDVLTAERDLADAETLAVNARAQVTVDWIALQKALGGGWRVTPMPAAHTKENS